MRQPDHRLVGVPPSLCVRCQQPIQRAVRVLGTGKDGLDYLGDRQESDPALKKR